MSQCTIEEEPNAEVLSRINRRIIRPFFKTLFITTHAQINFKERITRFFPELTDFYNTIRTQILTGEELPPDTFEFRYLKRHGQRFPDRNFRAWRNSIIQEQNGRIFAFYYPCAHKLNINKLFVLSVMPEEYIH